MSTVSVIIPCYNASLSIQRCLDSVLSQSFAAHEVIVIDDGSEDASAQIINNYGKPVRYIRQENKGQGAARNAGLLAATGDYIAFLDSDDYWQPGFLSACVQFLDEHDEVIAVNTAQEVRIQGQFKEYRPFCVNEKSITGPLILENFFEFWSTHNHIMTGSALIRSSVIKMAGVQCDDLRVSQDLEYWGYLATFGKWAFIPDPLFVTDGLNTAISMGWKKKYHIRRKRCPTVEQWQRRILPRLTEKDLPGFERRRGVTACGFAYNMILGGRDEEALHTVLTYQRTFPSHKLAGYMKAASRFPLLVWKPFCFLLRQHEKFRAWKFWLRYCMSSNGQ